MAVAVKKPHTPTQLYTLWYQIKLVPELMLLIGIGGAYLLFQQPTWLAFVGELVIALFLVRTLLMWLGWRAWQQGRYQRTARLSYAAWLLHPWSADVATMRAINAAAYGDLDQAIHYWQQAQRLFPERAATWIGLSTTYAFKAEWEKARWHAFQALSLDPTNSAALAALGQASLQLAQETSFVMQLVNQGLEHAPDAVAHSWNYLVRAEAAVQRRQPAVAKAAIEQTLRALPHCPCTQQAEYLYRIGQVYQQLGMAEAALHEWERIENIDPEGRWVARAWRSHHELSLHKNTQQLSA